jgi:hypothetical protein
VSDVTKQFELVTIEGKDYHSIRIIAEPFKDIIYRYGQVRLEPPKDDAGELKVEYEWFVEQCPYEKGEIDTEALKNMVNRITMHVFQQVSNENKIKDNL